MRWPFKGSRRTPEAAITKQSPSDNGASTNPPIAEGEEENSSSIDEPKFASCAKPLRDSLSQAGMIIDDAQRRLHRTKPSYYPEEPRQLSSLMCDLGRMLDTNVIRCPISGYLGDLWYQAMQKELSNTEVRSKAAFLLLDREFRDEILDPLQLILEKKIVESYLPLYPSVIRISNATRVLIDDRRKEYDRAWMRLKDSEDWRKAEGLNQRLNELETEACSAAEPGASPNYQLEWAELHPQQRFSSPEKPRILIAWLEEFIEEARNSNIDKAQF